VHDKILILDFGAQYSQLIARRVREAKSIASCTPSTSGDGFIRDFAPRGVILSGGPASVYEDATPKAPRRIQARGPRSRHLLRHETMAAQLGGGVENSKVREFGYAEVRARGHSKLLEGIQDRINGRKARPARRVDEPRPTRSRRCRRASSVIASNARPDRRDGRRIARFLRRAVSTRR